MPPFDITDPDDVARVTIVTDVNTQAFIPEMTFSHWIRGCAGLSPAAVAAAIETPLAALLGAAMADGIRAVLSSSCSIVRTEISKPLISPPPVSAETTRSLAGFTGGLLPPDCAVVVSFRSDTSGAAYRSRSYIGGINVAAIDSAQGTLGAAPAAALAADWNTYITQLQALTGDFEQITVSRFESVGGVITPRATPIGATVVTAVVDVHVDTQRRRGVR